MTMYADVLCRLRHTLQENLLMTQQQARTGLASRVVRRRCVAIDTVAGAGRAFTAGDVRRAVLCRVACQCCDVSIATNQRLQTGSSVLVWYVAVRAVADQRATAVAV